jgi:hypothetical protein
MPKTFDVHVGRGALRVVMIDVKNARDEEFEDLVEYLGGSGASPNRASGQPHPRLHSGMRAEICLYCPRSTRFHSLPSDCLGS